MATTAARLLTLLGLFQSRREWTAAELAERTGVSARTIRNDVARLRDLGYTVEAAPGRYGGYRARRGGQIPPLLLEEDEAVAVAVGLGLVGNVPGVAEAGETVLGKLEPGLPDRLRRRVRAVHDNLDVGPVTDSPHPPPPAVDTATLARIGAAIADHQGLRAWYRDESEGRELDPYRLVTWEERWYLVARDRRIDDFTVLRVDWLVMRTPDAGRFAPRPLEGGDYADLVMRQVASTGWAVHARIRIHAPAEEVRERINPAVGLVEAIDDHNSVLLTGADSYATIAVWIGLLGLDFHIDGPPELVDQLATLSDRYRQALPAGASGPSGPKQPRSR
ncbi:MAG: helix-turn-helix transcriptional regulator [Angustibacter sp.]